MKKTSIATVRTPFAGIIPPMVTPLTPDERIDGPAVERLVNFFIGHGVHGLFILGSIGEGAFLRLAEKRRLAEATVAVKYTGGEFGDAVGGEGTHGGQFVLGCLRRHAEHLG